MVHRLGLYVNNINYFSKNFNPFKLFFNFCVVFYVSVKINSYIHDNDKSRESNYQNIIDFPEILYSTT